jgi:hypothetical protein
VFDKLPQGSVAARVVCHGKRDGRVEPRVAGACRGVPAAPHHRVAPRHEECVSQDRGVGDRARVVSAGVEPPQRGPGLPTAVGRLVHHLVGALAQVDGLEDVEVERVLDVAVGVPRRERDVDDHGVERIVRVQLAERLADDLLVLSDARPGKASERGRFPCADLHPGDSRLCGRHRREDDSKDEQSRATEDRSRSRHRDPPANGLDARWATRGEVTGQVAARHSRETFCNDSGGHAAKANGSPDLHCDAAVTRRLRASFTSLRARAPRCSAPPRRPPLASPPRPARRRPAAAGRRGCRPRSGPYESRADAHPVR